MSALWFLAGALLLGVVGSAVIAWWHREPKVQHGEIDEFAARMKALAPRERERG